ncbi:ArsR/SmtB family transcription factor [Cerasicoccus arenae]|uniref:Transcriptional regulator n=1 Tax=Cerasicoccus arenae TaxID=424488 RepID=A0A8J3DK76_9BACT|nr:metalloregulator ArsR/SmtB family transcription factor [Cerasicoccus arenae]MBK1859574.1 helix-turn-helix transcriptional regulator [Cerasicoccus arenae]GHC03018.1 transcriptional regulator [Cerasicoccus arenae]
MLPKTDSPQDVARYAPIFAALGDETRLSLVMRLSDQRKQTLSTLSADTSLSRQAITKHLRVLEGAGLVQCERQGRESRYALTPGPFKDIDEYINFVSDQWGNALDCLKDLVE